MNKEELFSRLDELSWMDSILDALDASQWRFWRRKKQLNEAQMFPLVQEYIELLERHTHSRIRDVKDSAIRAINHIRKRLDC